MEYIKNDFVINIYNLIKLLIIIKHTLGGNSIDVMKNASSLPGFHFA